MFTSCFDNSLRLFCPLITTINKYVCIIKAWWNFRFPAAFEWYLAIHTGALAYKCVSLFRRKKNIYCTLFLPEWFLENYCLGGILYLRQQFDLYLHNAHFRATEMRQYVDFHNPLKYRSNLFTVYIFFFLTLLLKQSQASLLEREFNRVRFFFF